jgi:hypothetical protein
MVGKYLCNSSEIFIVNQRASKVRKSFRSHETDVFIMSNYLKQRKLEFQEIHHSEVSILISKISNSNVYMSLNLFDKDNFLPRSNNYIAVAWGADLYLSEASIIGNLHNLRKIEAIVKWKIGLSRLRNNSWILPYLPKQVITLGGLPVVSCAKNEIKYQSDMMIKSHTDVFKDSIGSNSKFLILSYAGKINKDWLNAVKTIFHTDYANESPRYLVKPHPNSKFNHAELRRIEKAIGYKSGNRNDQASLNIIKSLPLECFLLYFKNSRYLGTITGSINFIGKDRYRFVQSQNTRIENLNALQYSEFLKRLI